LNLPGGQAIEWWGTGERRLDPKDRFTLPVGSNEPKLTLKWSPRSPLSMPFTITLWTPFSRTSFAIIASSTSAVGLDIDKSNAEELKEREKIHECKKNRTPFMSGSKKELMCKWKNNKVTEWSLAGKYIYKQSSLASVGWKSVRRIKGR